MAFTRIQLISLSHFVLKSCLFYSLIFGRCIKEPCLSKSPHWQTQPLSIFSNRLLCFSKISGSLLNPKRTPLISLKTQGFSITLMSCVTFRDLGLCCFCSHHSPTHTFIILISSVSYISKPPWVFAVNFAGFPFGISGFQSSFWE